MAAAFLREFRYTAGFVVPPVGDSVTSVTIQRSATLSAAVPIKLPETFFTA